MLQFSGNKLVLSVIAPTAILSIRCVESGTLWQITTKRGNCRSRIIVSFEVLFYLSACNSRIPASQLYLLQAGSSSYYECTQSSKICVQSMPNLQVLIVVARLDLQTDGWFQPSSFLELLSFHHTIGDNSSTDSEKNDCGKNNNCLVKTYRCDYIHWKFLPVKTIFASPVFTMEKTGFFHWLAKTCQPW